MEKDGKIKAVVYTEDVNQLLRGLKKDLDRYFEVLDTGTYSPRSEGKVTHTDLTFGHWFYKLASRHWCKNPTKTIFVKDRRSMSKIELDLLFMRCKPVSEDVDLSQLNLFD